MQIVPKPYHILLLIWLMLSINPLQPKEQTKTPNRKERMEEKTELVFHCKTFFLDILVTFSPRYLNFLYPPYIFYKDK